MTTPIEYIDLIAYHLRMKEYENRSDLRASQSFGGLAHQVENSAAWFREQDTSLPPQTKRPRVSELYYENDTTWRGAGEE